MSNIYRDILSGTMDAFASVISNNLNIVMKVLAAVTIILTIRPSFFGLWGSNVPVPFESSPYGFFRHHWYRCPLHRRGRCGHGAEKSGCDRHISMHNTRRCLHNMRAAVFFFAMPQGE